MAAELAMLQCISVVAGLYMPATRRTALRFPATIIDSRLVQEESLANKNEITEKHRKEKRAMLFFFVGSFCACEGIRIKLSF